MPDAAGANFSSSMWSLHSGSTLLLGTTLPQNLFYAPSGAPKVPLVHLQAGSQTLTHNRTPASKPGIEILRWRVCTGDLLVVACCIRLGVVEFARCERVSAFAVRVSFRDSALYFVVSSQ